MSNDTIDVSGEKVDRREINDENSGARECSVEGCEAAVYDDFHADLHIVNNHPDELSI